MKWIIATVITGFLLSCGPNAEKREEKQASGADFTKSSDYQEGLALVAENRCLVCHSISDRLTGPSYKEIARMYAGYPDSIVSHLADRIIRGGNGVWGEVRMTPHPKVSKEEAGKMVRYILLLDKE